MRRALLVFRGPVLLDAMQPTPEVVVGVVGVQRTVRLTHPVVNRVWQAREEARGGGAGIWQIQLLGVMQVLLVMRVLLLRPQLITHGL